MKKNFSAEFKTNIVDDFKRGSSLIALSEKYSISEQEALDWIMNYDYDGRNIWRVIEHLTVQNKILKEVLVQYVVELYKFEIDNENY